VLGVNNAALRRKQQRYGTWVINLETHRPIDLLDDRTAGVFANSLCCHSGVEIVVRYRAGAHAELTGPPPRRSSHRRAHHDAPVRHHPGRATSAACRAWGQRSRANCSLNVAI
jgi:hypothetical protein